MTATHSTMRADAGPWTPGGRTSIPILVAGLLLAPCAFPALRAQERDGAGSEAAAASRRADDPAVIDTVIFVRDDIFTKRDARKSFVFRLMNDVHVTTQPYVIRREVLVRPGRPYDPRQAAETERNLRSSLLFRDVDVDTATVDGRLALVVHTLDAWSIKPRTDLRVASDGTLTGTFGATERNVLGTGNVVRVWYVKQVDRDGLVTAAGLPRIGGSRAGVGGTFLNLSDRTAGSWGAGPAFRSFADRWSVVASGRAFDGRVLQYRTRSPASRDTIEWQRRAFVNRLDWAFAPRASARGYLRVGGGFEVRREEYFLRSVPGASVPDTVYGLVGAWVEYRHANYRKLRRFNGFNEEDQDLSPVAFFGVKLAPGGWGYRRTGVGLRTLLAAGHQAGRWLLKARFDAIGLFNGAGLDSGRVSARWTAALRSTPRHVSLVSLAGGVLENPPPGGEVDLGFHVPPRLWAPHSFTGTRSIGLTAEHRWFARDDIFHLLGVGAGAFLDYGGAWFRGQGARAGGDVGLSLFIGSPVGAFPQISQLSAGYLFGGGIGGSGDSRWGVSLSSGVHF
ncbi:MAG: hypothetical protein ACE5HQ_09145 [Gemmatimonadota bacterium]